MNFFLVRNTWAAKVKVGNGEYKTLTSGVKSSREGIKWMDEKKSIRVEAESAIHRRVAREGLDVVRGKARSVLFDEVLALYMENFNYEDSHIKLFRQVLCGREIQDISVLDIRRLHNKIVETRKPTTWNKYRNALNAIFNRAIEWGFCEKNPVKAVKAYPENLLKEFLTKEQADAYLHEARKENYYCYALVYFALKTGRRKSEILDVEWDDIDFDNEQIRYRIRKKKGGLVTVARRHPKSLFQMLNLLKSTNKDKPFPFFPDHSWERVRGIIEERFKLPDRRFHALRHRCATEMIDNGATLYDVQYYLCHSNPQTTMIYAHVSDKRDERIAAFLE